MILKKTINVKHVLSGDMYSITGMSVNTTIGSNRPYMVLYEEYTTNRDNHYSKNIDEFIEQFELENGNLEELLNTLKF